MDFDEWFEIFMMGVIFTASMMVVHAIFRLAFA
jgi:hypothetical protein